MATKHLAATYNKANYPVVRNTTWCKISDACLQEGVTLEAISLVGHWRLNNLVVIYDNNQITCDGSVDLCNSENVNAKMVASGWNVIDVEDGNHDIEGIVLALLAGKNSSDKPTFINIRTVIGIGSKFDVNAEIHGTEFGSEDVTYIKRSFGQDPEKDLIISNEVYDYFREARPRGRTLEADWNE